MFYGIKKQFDGIYKHLSVLFVHQCFPVRMEEAKEIDRIYMQVELFKEGNNFFVE
jgi:hypothetical protein